MNDKELRALLNDHRLGGGPLSAMALVVLNEPNVPLDPIQEGPLWAQSINHVCVAIIACQMLYNSIPVDDGTYYPGK